MLRTYSEMSDITENVMTWYLMCMFYDGTFLRDI